MTPAVLDITLFLVLFLSTALACWRGFVREMFTIIGLGVSAFAALKGGHYLIPFFNNWLGVKEDGGAKAAEAVSKGANADAATQVAIDAAHSKAHLILGIISPELAAKLCAYGAAFIGVFLFMSLISFVVSRSIQEMGLGLVDRLAGAVFGFVRGFLLIFLPYVVCFILMGKDIGNFPDWAKNSASVPLLGQAYAAVDEKFGIGQKIIDRGSSLELKLDGIKKEKEKAKVDSAAEQELKDAITREEKESVPPQ